MKLCTNCLRDGNETLIEGHWKQCEPCRVKQRVRRWKNKASVIAWKLANPEKNRIYSREYERRKRQNIR